MCANTASKWGVERLPDIALGCRFLLITAQIANNQTSCSVTQVLSCITCSAHSFSLFWRNHSYGTVSGSKNVKFNKEDQFTFVYDIQIKYEYSKGTCVNMFDHISAFLRFFGVGVWVCVRVNLITVAIFVEFPQKTVLPSTEGACVHQSQADMRRECWGLLAIWKGGTDSYRSSGISMSLWAQHTATVHQHTLTVWRNFKYNMWWYQVMSRKNISLQQRTICSVTVCSESISKIGHMHDLKMFAMALCASSLVWFVSSKQFVCVRCKAEETIHKDNSLVAKDSII